MMYSSSKEAIKRALNGLAADIQANDADDIEFDNIKSRVSRALYLSISRTQKQALG
jgi:cofilin